MPADLDLKFDTHGMVLKHRPVGEYDWIVTLLTAERGKINAFARGARKPGTRLSGNVEPFCFGTFTLFPGKSSYSLNDAQIDYFFDSFRNDLEKATYGTFFLELADYYTRENVEAAEYLNLLFVSLRALESDAKGLSNRLVRCIYEIRAMVTEGIFPGVSACGAQLPAVQHALAQIASAQTGRLYTFTLSDEALEEMDRVTRSLRRRFVDRRLNSLEMLTLYE